MIRSNDSDPDRCTTTVVLVSNDGSLQANVAKMVAEIDRLELQVVSSPFGAASLVCNQPAGLVIFHLAKLEDFGGIRAAVRELSAVHDHHQTIVISDDHHPAQAVDLFKEGVADYLTRPLNLRRLAYLCDTLTLAARRGSDSAADHGEQIMALSPSQPFLYSPGEIERVVTQLKTLAPLDTTILIRGETGTGKSRMAKLIHELSPRKKAPFITIDCGSISWRLLESEIFGHVKGSFTGADGTTPGKLTSAGDGTIVIEEIDVIPLQLQSKFLRAVDEHVYEPVGGSQQLPLRARIIVTTNRSLQDEVAAGRFRSDLYYRINVLSFELPPLRERREMIPVLAEYYVKDIARHQNRTPPIFSPEAMRILRSYAWPGNIRELQNVANRCVTLATQSMIEASDLPSDLRHPVDLPAPNMLPVEPQPAKERGSRLLSAKQHAEAEVIRDALIQCGNNRAETARELGISRVTLYKKLHNYGFM